MDRLSDYAYHLPERLIAQTPLGDRAASRLMVLRRNGHIEHRMFREVTDLLLPGDLLVMNDTRVSALRLFGKKPSGATVEVLLMRELEPGRFEALVKPGRRLKAAAKLVFDGGLEAQVAAELGAGLRLLEFGAVTNLRDRLNEVGLVPLPPYIHERLDDPERYQTVYGVAAGSSAAPTAGLHFTPAILDALAAKGIRLATLTLNVGLDTFRPVQVEDLSGHEMHGETCQITDEAADAVNGATGRIIAVGTTTVRTLESFATAPRRVAPGTQVSRVFIRPGYDFKVVNGMFTNFHLPGTTMLMMIAALVGRERLFIAYHQAIAENYRFLSFGDSMLVV